MACLQSVAISFRIAKKKFRTRIELRKLQTRDFNNNYVIMLFN